MIAGLRPYLGYKESGVDELGPIPADWRTTALGQLGKFLKGTGGNKDDEVSEGIPCVRYGDLYTQHDMWITRTRSYITHERAADYTLIRLGDVVFATSGEALDEIGQSAVNLMRGEVRAGGDLLILRPTRSVSLRFLGYACSAAPSVVQKARMGKGVTVVHIHSHALKHLQIAFPPLGGQAAIVRFLDHLDSRIQRLVATKERLIELLEAERQTILMRAVTRGLRPDVSFKPSRIEWLGDVPEHWAVPKLHQAFPQLGSGTTPPGDEARYYVNGDIPWVNTRDLRDKPIGSTIRMVTRMALQDFPTLRLYPPGSIALAMYGATIGRVGLLQSAACVNQACCVLPPSKSLEPEYALFLFTTLRPHLVRLAVGGGQPNISQGIVRQFRIPIPPRGEQQAMLAELRALLRHLDLAAGKAARHVHLLRELRTRLISDVVTGKLDVREAVAKLPSDLDADAPALDEALEEPVAA